VPRTVENNPDGITTTHDQYTLYYNTVRQSRPRTAFHARVPAVFISFFLSFISSTAARVSFDFRPRRLVTGYTTTCSRTQFSADGVVVRRQRSPPYPPPPPPLLNRPSTRSPRIAPPWPHRHGRLAAPSPSPSPSPSSPAAALAVSSIHQRMSIF